MIGIAVKDPFYEERIKEYTEKGYGFSSSRPGYDYLRPENIPNVDLSNRLYRIQWDIAKTNEELQSIQGTFIDDACNKYNLVVEFLLCDDEQFDFLKNHVKQFKNTTGLKSSSGTNFVVDIATVRVILVPYVSNENSAQYFRGSSNVTARFVNASDTEHVICTERVFFKTQFHDNSLLMILTETFKNGLHIMKTDTGRISEIDLCYTQSDMNYGKRTATISDIFIRDYLLESEKDECVDKQLCPHERHYKDLVDDDHYLCARCGKTIPLTPPNKEEIDAAISTLQAAGDWVMITENNLQNQPTIANVQLYNQRLGEVEQFAKMFIEGNTELTTRVNKRYVCTTRRPELRPKDWN